MAEHVRTTKQSYEDRVRLKQVALLWWAQKIYEAAHTVCREGKAYEDVGGENKAGCYKDVIGVLADTVAKLNAIKSAAPTRQRVRPAFANAEMGRGLLGGMERAQVPLPGAPNATYQPDCSDDSDCPEGYICDDGEYCVYLFPELPSSLRSMTGADDGGAPVP